MISVGCDVACLSCARVPSARNALINAATHRQYAAQTNRFMLCNPIQKKLSPTRARVSLESIEGFSGRQTPLTARRRCLCGLGIRGSVGVTGMSFGGVFAGRLAACFSNASRTYELVAVDGVFDLEFL
jgi:hypothetical protein